MSNEIKEANRREDKKKFGGFILFLVICTIAGMAGGFIIAYAEDNLNISAWGDMAARLLKDISIYANLVLSVISIIIVAALYRNVKKLQSGWDEEDEEVLKRMERRMSIALLVSSVNQILLFVFMEIGFLKIAEMFSADYPKEVILIRMIIFGAGIIVTNVFGIVSQQKIVNFEKELNPEKKGSVFDMKFQDKWLESCDEMEKAAIYESAFASYKAVNITCMILWFFSLAGMLCWDFGVLPVVLIGIIWMVSMVSYCIKAMNMEKR